MTRIIVTPVLRLSLTLLLAATHKPEALAKDAANGGLACASGLYDGIEELPEVKARRHRSPDELELLRDAADGRFDEHRLYDAALTAGAASANDRLDCHTRVARLRRDLAHRLDGAATADGPRIVFEFLHGRVLTGGYRDDASNVAVALRGGPYNCLSAAILFIDLAHGAGFEAHAVQAPGHVFSRVYVSGDQPRLKSLDIELTAPDHFKRPLTTRRAEGESQHRVLSPVELVALVYFNRGVEELARGQFAAAAAANLTALAIDPASRTAADNLLATMNNWALALARAGSFDDALRIVKAARQIAPDHPHLWTNQRYLQSRISDR